MSRLCKVSVYFHAKWSDVVQQGLKKNLHNSTTVRHHDSCVMFASRGGAHADFLHCLDSRELWTHAIRPRHSTGHTWVRAGPEPASIGHDQSRSLLFQLNIAAKWSALVRFADTQHVGQT